MYNYYNTLNHNLKRGILKFSEKISKNLSRPQFKFVSQMMFGILSGSLTPKTKNNLRKPGSLTPKTKNNLRKPHGG